MAKVIFDGVGNMPELNRLTAKKNYASSSQSHKMGATAAFNDILHYLAEEKYPDFKNEVGGRVAVYQHPVYGFQKKLVEGTKDQYIHDFIGLYTVGADKGDKGYFGFSDSSIKKTAIRLEGTDHLKGVGFNYPWEVNGVKTIRYNNDKEALCIVTGSDKTKWTAILEQSACGSAETEEEIEAYLEQEFRPAYECAYNNNPLIVGADMDIATINGNIDAFHRMRRTDDRPYSYCEFWIDGEYDLYYLNQERGVYEKNGINLCTDLGISQESLEGLTLGEKNQLFINARVERFKQNATKYFHKNDTIFQLTFLFIIAASDNGEKNMYPYKMGTLASGSRWRFLQDDLDSIFSTDNQGQDTKPYSVELHDFTDETKQAYVFKGEDSALWQLVELAWPAEMRQMGYDVLQAMYDLSSKGTKTTDKLMGFFDDYFFSRAQEYFTKSAYNNDTEYSYEEAWNNKDYVASVDIHPLAQALGGHLSAERAWVEKRIVYLMSKYGFGGYSSYEDTALGIISVRTQVAQGFTLTPAIDSYPTILGGQAQVSSATEKILAGTPVTLSAVGGGNTNTYIVGADFLSDIGDLKDLSIDPSSVVTLSVASKRLRRLKVGDENPEEVTSYLATLSIQHCDSLETIDARNLQTLVGTVDLTQCPRLRDALFGGTNATSVLIAAGSKIEKLELPDSITAIDLRDNKFLSDFDYGTLANLRFLRLEGTPIVNGFAMLREAYNSEGQQLKDIRLVGFEYDGDDKDIDMLANISNDLDKDGNEHLYNGIDNQGNPTEGNPVIEGKLNIDGYVYEDTANVVRQNFPTIEFTPKGYYIRFADPEVLRVLLANNIGDGTGITKAAAQSVTGAFPASFDGNGAIVTFNEFHEFTGVTSIKNTCFMDCVNLESIILPNNIVSIYSRCFTRSGIKSIATPQSLLSVPSYCFEGCPNLETVVLNEGLTKIEVYSFQNSGNLKSINIPSSVNSIGQSAFYGCKSLKDVNIEKNSQLETISSSAFRGCTSLDTIALPEGLTNIGSNAFASSGLVLINIPDGVIELANSVFTYCSNISTVTITKNSQISSIGAYAFYYCSSLTTITIPEGVTSIGNMAFQYCSLLNKVICWNHLPPTLGSNVFSNTSKTLEIYVPDQSLEAYRNAENWVSYASQIWPMEAYLIGIIKFADPVVASICAANFDKNGTGYVNLDEAKEVTTFPAIFKGNTEITSFDEFERFENVTALAFGAFEGCTSLTSITFPHLEVLPGKSFKGCSSLSIDVSLPHLQSMPGSYNFFGSGIRRVLNLGSITTIPDAAFQNCKNLVELTIPSTCSAIKVAAISGCSALKTIVCNPINPPTIPSDFLRGLLSTGIVVYVPDDSVSAYKSATNWSKYADRIKPLSEYQE